ncbi:hypothetical protein I7I53_06082 [Histoplasma capsulatum var. duboisii H88]|uniref:Uncharacterized protein n=1 Tax=Ajellomyces capsulatus (strain H88) TaxID=544711 RepID=A0A8A1L9Z6_AJEC8|nr:hypothetical protein I7I53_06082 [Histoplasma capsulatum var. duboisii H88]
MPWLHPQAPWQALPTNQLKRADWACGNPFSLWSTELGHQNSHFCHSTHRIFAIRVNQLRMPGQNHFRG